MAKRQKNQPPVAAQSNTPTPYTTATAQSQIYDPFPTRIEKLLFKRPWITIFLAGTLVLLGNQRLDIPFLSTTIVLTISASLFKHWLNLLPKTLNTIKTHCNRSREMEISECLVSFNSNISGLSRLAFPIIALFIASVFLKKFLCPHTISISLLTWITGMGIWAWMIGASGSTIISVSRLFYSLGKQDTIRPQPEHPDQCGGLEPIGTFFAWMVSPLILVSTFLTLTALDPKLPPIQHYKFLHPLSTPDKETIKELKEREALIKKSELFNEIGLMRIERLKKTCTEIESNPFTPDYRQCVSRIEAETKAISYYYEKPRAPIWNPTVVKFSILGITILIPIAIICFIWPLFGIHRSMVKERDTNEARNSNLLEILLQQIQSKTEKENTSDILPSLTRASEIRKQLFPAPRPPVWPFKASTLRNLAMPQLAALVGLAMKNISSLIY